MCRYTYWTENDSYYFHIAKKNLGYEKPSRVSPTAVEGKGAVKFLDPIIIQIKDAKQGQLIPIFEDNMTAATMTRKDVGFWDESPYCYRSFGLIIRVTYNKRTESYVFHFLRPNRNEKFHDWIGSSFSVATPQVRDLVTYMKKKLRM